jgi:hypothetical protein
MVDLGLADIINLGVGGIFLWVYIEERKYTKTLTERVLVILEANTRALQEFRDTLKEYMTHSKIKSS